MATPSPPALDQAAAPPPRLAVGFRATASPMTANSVPLLWGIDIAYAPMPVFAAGFEYDQTLLVDNHGAPPGYCEGCLLSARTGRAFAEVRPFAPHPVLPFLRGSAGIAVVDVREWGRTVAHSGAAFGAAAGVEGRLGHVYARLFAFVTIMPNSGRPESGTNDLGGVGLELGGVF